VRRGSDEDVVDGLDPEAIAPLLRAIFAASHDAIGVASAATIRVANPAFAALFGYADEGELIGMPALDLVTPGARELVAEMVRRRAAGEEVPSIYRTQGLRRDGTEFTMEVRSTSYQLRGEIYSLLILRDVTSQQKAERAERQHEEFYRAMFEVNTAVKLLIDPTSGRIVDANQAAVHFYGWSLEVLRTMRITDINTLTADEVKAEMDHARTGRRRYFRFRHRLASGEIRHVEVHSGPVEVDSEQLLFSIVFDVTERDALEQQLRQVRRLEAIGRLAGGVAHDFNNLLTIILTCAEVLVRRSSGDPRLQPYADDLAGAAQRAAELTRGLLAFSRRQVLEPAALELNPVIERVAALLRRTLPPSIELVLELDPSLPTVLADPSRVDEVVMNLALNGRDAMPAGGRLILRSGTTVIEHRDAAMLPPGRWATLVVSDTGEGMDEATRGQVFEPFFTTKPSGQGTGLGLATVYGTVTQGGGHVAVESEPGRGSTFTVLLPIAPAAPRCDPPSEVRPPPPAPGTRLLLVEDMSEVRTTLADALRRAGFEVLEARSAEEAAALSVETLDQLDAVVSDVVMPGRSGVELALELLGRRPELPLLLVSGDLGDSDRSRLPARVRFLQKPFASEQLLRALAELLGGGRPA
jgi:two-component system, cell cycle sensor histidine kinase and response regulator CckA